MEKTFDSELERVLDFFREDEDTYKYTIFGNEEDDQEEYEFYEEIKKVMNEFNVTWEFTNCGGFDSPGYSIDCYCLAYIDPKTGLQTIPVAFECR